MGINISFENKSIIQKTLLAWLGFLMSFVMIILIDSKYKGNIIGDLLSYVLIILLIGSSILLWKACDNIKPTALRIIILGIQFSALIIASYSITVYYLIDILGKKL